MKIIELIHDLDHPATSNVELWLPRHKATTTKVYAYKNETYPKQGSFDLLIVHGGEQHLWNKEATPWLHNEIDFVKKTFLFGTPVIGFCLGSQIIAEALAGSVYPAKRPENGFFLIEPYPKAVGHPLLKGLKHGFSTFLWHSDHYTLPDGCEALAFTKLASNQIIVSEKYPVVGYQFHPEYTNQIIDDFVNAFPDQSWVDDNGRQGAENLLQSLRARPDSLDLFTILMDNAIRWFDEKFLIRSSERGD